MGKAIKGCEQEWQAKGPKKSVRKSRWKWLYIYKSNNKNNRWDIIL